MLENIKVIGRKLLFSQKGGGGAGGVVAKTIEKNETNFFFPLKARQSKDF